MKRISLILLMFIMIFSFVFSFTACDKDGNIQIDVNINDNTDKPGNTDECTHTYVDGKCSNCGEADPDYKPDEQCEHNYVDGKCTKCDEADPDYNPGCSHAFNSVGKEPTCSATGHKTYTCRLCGYSYTETLPTVGHDYGSDGMCKWCRYLDPNYNPDEKCDHNYVDGKCTKCDEADPNYKPTCSHSFSTVTKNPTCSEPGHTIYTCRLCEHSYKETIPVTDHVYGSDDRCQWCGQLDPDYIPDECKHNYVDGFCTECKEPDPNYKPGGDPDCDHYWTKPSCTQDGYCEHCGAVGESATGHVPGRWLQTGAATCVNNGQLSQYCDICGDLLAMDIIPSTGVHNFIDGYCEWCKELDPDYKPSEECKHNYLLTESKEAACGVAGYSVYTCVYCKDSYTMVQEALTHIYFNGSCELCGAPDPGYIGGEDCHHVWVPATCTVDGHCELCGARSDEDAFGHNYDENGYCYNCGDFDPEHTTGCKHEWVNGFCPLCESSCDHIFEGSTCTNCGYASGGIDNPITIHFEGMEYTLPYSATFYDFITMCLCLDYYEATAGYTWILYGDGEFEAYEYLMLCEVGRTIKAERIYNGGEFPGECHHNFVGGYCELCGMLDPGYIPSECPHNFVDGYCEWCKEPDPNYNPGTEDCPHDYDTTTYDPTCTEPGHRTSHCIICGHYIDEVLPMLGHTPDEKGFCTMCGTPCGDGCMHSYMEESTPPTCEVDGYYHYICIYCGAIENYYTIPAIGHNWSYGDCANPPYCYNCGTTNYDEVFPHEWTYYSCEDYERCARCGMMSGNPPKGHNFVGGYCTDCGVYDPGYMPECDHYYLDGYCQWCGMYDSNYKPEIPECEHSWVAATCTEDGYCEFCKMPGESAMGHTEGSWVITEIPTCRIDGQELLYCMICNGVMDERTIPSTGHSYETKVVEPTCNEFGYTVYTCASCGNSYEADYIAPLGHNYGYSQEEVPPTCNELGYTLLVCHCGESVKDVVFTPANGHTWSGDSCSVCGTQKQSQGFEFTFVSDVNEGGYYKITGIGSCTDTNVIIPDVYEGYPVRHIAKLTRGQMESIVIPDSIVWLDSSAFRLCVNLTEIAIPKNVKHIELDGFEGCSSLERIIVSDENEYFKSVDGVLYTKDGSTLLFYPGAKKDETLVIPKGLTNIAKNAFAQAKHLKSVTIPEGYKKNSDAYPFYNCTSIEEVILPSTTEEIYMSMFYGCSNLKSINLPDGLTTIHTSAFEGCSSLTSVIMPDTVLGLGSKAFYGCTSLEIVKISAGLAEIQQSAFYNCVSLTSVIIPDSIEKIQQRAFERCTSLKTLVIGSGIRSMGSDVFKDTYISNVYYNGTAEMWAEILPKISYQNEEITDKTIHFYSEAKPTEVGNFWHYENGVPTVWPEYRPASEGLSFGLSSSKTYYILYGIGDCTDTEVIIPATYSGLPVREIFPSAFQFNTTITSIVIPDGVEKIGWNAFYGASNLKTVVLPDSITLIEDQAFFQCTRLESINLPKCITEIGNDTFNRCVSLKEIIIPDNVTSIGQYAFYKCESLETVVLSKSLTYIGYAAFNSTSPTNVTIPDSVMSIAKSHFNKPHITDSDNTIITEDGYVFAHKNGVYSLISYVGNDVHLVLPESINGESYTVARGAFSYRNDILTIVISSGVTAIEGSSFNNMSNLLRVTLGENLTSIQDYAFSSCYKLVEVCNLSKIDLSRDYSNVAKYALEIYTNENDTALFFAPDGMIIYFGETLYIMGYTGDETDIILPESITGYSYEVYKYAFAYNFDLTSVTITGGITDIGECAFYYAIGLKNIFVNEDNAYYTSNDGILFNSDMTELIAYPAARPASTYCVPESVTKIASYAFLYADSLLEVYLSNVVEIGNYVFHECVNISTIDLGTSLEIMGSNLYNSGSVHLLIIPKTLKNVNDYAIGSYYNYVYFRGTEAEWQDVVAAMAASSNYNNFSEAKITYNYSK